MVLYLQRLVFRYYNINLFGLAVKHFLHLCSTWKFCVFNMLFHIRLPYVATFKYFTCYHNIQKAIKFILHNLHSKSNSVFCSLSILWTLLPLFNTTSMQLTDITLDFMYCVCASFTTTTACLWPACTIVVTKNAVQFT